MHQLAARKETHAVILYVVRHGQPIGHGGSPSTPNPGLTPTGQRQAEQVAQQLEAWGIDYLYSSSQARAIETALPVHRRLAVPWAIWAPACETDRRNWPKNAGLPPEERAAARTVREDDHLYYRPLSELAKEYGASVEQPIAWPDHWWPPLRLETQDEAYARGRSVLSALMKRHRTEDRVALVCHGAFGSVLLSLLCECPPAFHNRFSHTHAGITRVDIDEKGAVSLRFLNYVEHLSGEGLITETVDPVLPRFPRPDESGERKESS